MSAPLLSIWGLARPWAVEWTLLILIGASVLGLRAFRENYFTIWVLGWAALVASDSPSIVFAP